LKSICLTYSLLLLTLLVAAGHVRAQVYHYVPRSSSRQKTNWYTARKPTTTQKQNYYVPVLTPAEATAKAELDRMAAALNGSEGIQFDSTISYPTGSAEKVQTKQTTATTTIERYIRMMIETTNNGQTEGVIAADGNKFTLYDSAKSQYVQITTTPDLFSLQQALELGGKQVFPKGTAAGRDLRISLEFPMLYLSKVFDENEIPVGYSLAYTEASATSDDSKPVLLITATLSSVKTGSIAASYMIDPTTNLPVQFSQIETKPGKQPIFDIQETFKNFKALHKALSASTYAYNLPQGATMAPAEAKLTEGN